LSPPQTGVAAWASEWEMWGVNLAVEEINAAGGLLGGRKLELMVLDNKCNPSEAVNVANKLVEAKVVAIEGAHCSSAHLASMKIVADAKIPMVTGIASNPQITALAGPGRNEYSFRISPSDSAMMEALGIYLGNKKAFKTVAIVGEDTDFGRGGADAFKAVADKAGVTVGSTDFHPQNAPDLPRILTPLQQRRRTVLPSGEGARLHQNPDASAAAPARRHRHLPGRRRFDQLPAPGHAARRQDPLYRPHRVGRAQPADHRGRRHGEVDQRLDLQRHHRLAIQQGVRREDQGQVQVRALPADLGRLRRHPHHRPGDHRL